MTPLHTLVKFLKFREVSKAMAQTESNAALQQVYAIGAAKGNVSLEAADQVIRLLVEHGADLDARAGKYGTAAEFAAQQKMVDLVPLIQSRQATSAASEPTRMDGDALWAQAVDAAGSGRAEQAVRMFSAVILKNPWKYCGVGRDSVKPSQPATQTLWLEGMTAAGFGEVADALRIPPRAEDLTIMTMMEADRQVEMLLQKSCEARGIKRSG